MRYIEMQFNFGIELLGRPDTCVDHIIAQQDWIFTKLFFYRQWGGILSSLLRSQSGVLDGKGSPDVVIEISVFSGPGLPGFHLFLGVRVEDYIEDAKLVPLQAGVQETIGSSGRGGWRILG